jgi:hypothetical protein
VPSEPDETVNVLRSVWQASGSADLDEVCGPQRSCRNMRDVGFDGLAEPGADLRSAWRDRLRREGKLAESGQTVRDLVLGAERPR